MSAVNAVVKLDLNLFEENKVLFPQKQKKKEFTNQKKKISRKNVGS